MKHLMLLLPVFFILISPLFAQKVTETGFEAGFNATSSPGFERRWNHSTSQPVFLTLGALKSWYNENHKISFRKELGLSMQYANIDLSGGGLGAGSSYSGNITSLFVTPSLLAHFKVSPKISADLGPTMDYLIVGANHFNHSSYSTFPGIGGNGEQGIKGLNRDYFNKPSYGIKARLTGISVEEKFTIGVSFTYLWTKSGYENFDISNYAKISFYLGFKKSKQPKEESESL
jgi:hypothetical protein